MLLTAELLARFVGGEMEIQNMREDYLYRGPIESATIEGDEVRVRFRWLAKNDGGSASPTATWTKADRLDYAVSMQICSVSNIGQGRICLNVPVTGELVVLFPPSGSKLDPARVAGLAAA